MKETTEIRFSEAIRLGSMMSPQAFGTLSGIFGLFRPRKKTCAIGAALEAFPCKSTPNKDGVRRLGFRGEATSGGNTILFPNEWAVVMWTMRECPECPGVIEPVFRIVASHLNDKHRWARERIADWVEKLENSLEIPRIMGSGEPPECSPVDSRKEVNLA